MNRPRYYTHLITGEEKQKLIEGVENHTPFKKLALELRMSENAIRSLVIKWGIYQPKKKNYQHVLSNIDKDERIALCQCCGWVRIQRRGDKDGKAWKCEKANNQRAAVRDRPYRQFLKEFCERCDFVPEHTCQLDIHHRDNDHSNNDPSNLMTICANCHRLHSIIPLKPIRDVLSDSVQQ